MSSRHTIHNKNFIFCRRWSSFVHERRNKKIYHQAVNICWDFPQAQDKCLSHRCIFYFLHHNHPEDWELKLVWDWETDFDTYVSGTVPLVDWSAGVAPVSLSRRALAAECLASFFDLPVPIAAIKIRLVLSVCRRFANDFPSHFILPRPTLVSYQMNADCGSMKWEGK